MESHSSSSPSSQLTSHLERMIEGVFTITLQYLTPSEVLWMSSCCRSIRRQSVIYYAPQMLWSYFSLPPSSDIFPQVRRLTGYCGQGDLPPHLTELSIGKWFNAPLSGGMANTFPVSLTHLSFKGGAFNKPLEATDLPPNLTHLTLGNRFNQPLAPGTLPASLLELRIGETFSQELGPGVLPNGLKVLMLGSHFCPPKECVVLPPTLTHLVISSRFMALLPAAEFWPPGLTEVWAGDSRIDLPGR